MRWIMPEPFVPRPRGAWALGTRLSLIGKSSPAKFANFVYIRIMRKSFDNLFVKSWFFPARTHVKISQLVASLQTSRQ